jgi:hypothetical protein
MNVLKRPCGGCGKAAYGPYLDGQCRACWLYLNDYRYRRAYDLGEADGKAPIPRASPLSLPCRFRGESIGEVECPSCQGNVRVKTFGCDAFGSCTLLKEVRGLACCRTCTAREPETEGER